MRDAEWKNARSEWVKGNGRTDTTLRHPCFPRIRIDRSSRAESPTGVDDSVAKRSFPHRSQL